MSLLALKIFALQEVTPSAPDLAQTCAVPILTTHSKAISNNSMHVQAVPVSNILVAQSMMTMDSKELGIVPLLQAYKRLLPLSLSLLLRLLSEQSLKDLASFACI